MAGVSAYPTYPAASVQPAAPYPSAPAGASVYPTTGPVAVAPPAVPTESPEVSLRRKQMEVLSRYIRLECDYRELLTYFPMPKDISHELYRRAMGHGIHPRYWPMLNVMRIFDFAFVVDNSGSMSASIDNKDLPRGERYRYKELMFNSARLADIMVAADADGVDVYTLNPISVPGAVRSNFAGFHGSRFANVNSATKMAEIVGQTPRGGTPLTSAMQAAITDHRVANSNPLKPYKPLMLIVATDGQPANRAAFYRLVKERNRDQVFITFLICSDNPDDTSYLDSLDTGESQKRLTSSGRRKVDGVESIDDFRSERASIIRIQGRGFGYTRGDHEARKLCGPVFPILDKIDQEKLPDFTTPGEDYMPPEIQAVILEIASNSRAAEEKMREYAKGNPEIARYMLDLPPPPAVGCGCILM